MFEPTGSSINDDMKEAIPFIVNRKIRGVKERTNAILQVATAILG